VSAPGAGAPEVPGSPAGPARHGETAPARGQRARPTPTWPIRWPPAGSLPAGPGARLGRPALTILELVIAAALLVTAAAVAIPAYVRSRESSRVLQAVSDIVTVGNDIAVDEATRGGPPPTLASIGRGALLDPWGRPYRYLVTAGAGVGQDRRDRLFKPLNTDYDLYSLGKDGKTQQKLDHPDSLDDVVRALNGAYVGLALEF
jgi:general secretion pathway protein G